MGTINPQFHHWRAAPACIRFRRNIPKKSDETPTAWRFFFPQTVCPHWGALAVIKGKKLGLDHSMLCGPRHFHCKFLRKSSLVRCPCAFRLCRLAQDGLERRFPWQVQDMGHFFIRAARVALSTRCENVGRRVSKWEVFFGGNFSWRRFGRVENRFVKLSSFVIWDMMMIPCGRCRTSDALVSFFVAGAVLCRHCRPRQKGLKPSET